MCAVSITDREAKLRERAEKALHKPAAYGSDIDPKAFIEGAAESPPIQSLEDLPKRLREASLLAGLDPTEKSRSGSYLQQDDQVLYERVREAYGGQVEVMAIEQALQRYDWLWDYWWRAVPVDADKYTAYTQLRQKGGYFMRIRRGQKVELPIQACLLMSEKDASQRVHNIIIAEPGSQAEIITGCSTSPGVEGGLHLGVSEFYVQEGASLSFTMVHNWGEGFHVRPRTGVVVEEGASFTSNYVLLKPLASLQTNPKAMLVGKGAKARFNSIIHAQEDSYLDVGSVIELRGEDTRGEAVSRAAVSDKAKVVMRGLLHSGSDTAKGYLSCNGLLLSRQATIQAVPQLLVSEAPGADLSHEAAIGPVDEESVQYLMMRGLDREEAESAIIQGFMRVGIEGLPAVLEGVIKDLGQRIKEGGRV